MRAGIMQPYFFPYLGHFGLIAACDTWVVFDVSQYTRRTWMTRNRVLHPTNGWTYISVPLAESSTQIRIHQARLAHPARTLAATLGALSHYRRHAPHYDDVIALVTETFAGDPVSLVALNLRGLQTTCRYLGIPFRPLVCSELGLDLPPAMAPGEWAPTIARAIGATSYLNPAGGAHLFDADAFHARGLTLHFAETPPFAYPTRSLGFVPNLSFST